MLYILGLKNLIVLFIAILCIVKVTIDYMQQEIRIDFLFKIVISVVESFIHWVSATRGLQASLSAVPVGNIRFIFCKKHKLFIHSSYHPRICYIFLFDNFAPTVKPVILYKFNIAWTRIKSNLHNYVRE